MTAKQGLVEELQQAAERIERWPAGKRSAHEQSVSAERYFEQRRQAAPIQMSAEKPISA